MDKYTLARKCLVVGIILLFIGLTGIQSINANNPILNHITNVTYKSNITLNNGTLSGLVTDSEKNPIEGARVRVYFHDTYSENYSDSTGYFHVTNISICNCTKNATCSKEGYYPAWVYLTIWDNTTYDFILTPFDMTELAITSISPFTIKNVGNTTAFNVSWSITINGGIILIGKSSSGVLLGSLEPGQEVMVRSSKFLLGFGYIEITFAAWADNAPMVSVKITGRLLLYFFFPQ
jgi:Carboxypeptidase regulatory-like domain